MRPASTFILSSVNPHALAGFPTELKPSIDEALQDPKILRKILTNKKIATNPQFVDMMLKKTGKEHPALLLDAITQPAVIDALEVASPKTARYIELLDEGIPIDEQIEGIYENATADLLKIAAQQDPESLLEFATEDTVFPILVMEDPELPGEIADVFEEEFGKLGTLAPEDDTLIRDLREMGRVARGTSTLGGDTLGWNIWGRIKKAAKSVGHKIKSAYHKVKKAAGKVYHHTKTAVRKAYHKIKTRASKAYHKIKTKARSAARKVKNAATGAYNKAREKARKATEAVKRKAREVAAAVVRAKKAAVARVAAAKKAALARVAAAKKKAFETAKRLKKAAEKRVEATKKAVIAAKKRVAEISSRIKKSKEAAVARLKKAYKGIRGSVGKTMTKVKNVVGTVGKTFTKAKEAAIRKTREYRKKVTDYKNAMKKRMAESYKSVKKAAADKAKAAMKKAWGITRSVGRKLKGVTKTAGNALRKGADTLKKTKDAVTNAGKSAWNLTKKAAKAGGAGLLAAGTAVGGAIIAVPAAVGAVGLGVMKAVSGFFGDKAAAQEENAEEPNATDAGEPGAVYDEAGAYDAAAGGMEPYGDTGVPPEEYPEAEEEYPEEEGLPPEPGLPEGAECKSGEEMPEEQMVCTDGSWKCKEGAKMEIEPGLFMTCTNGEWVTPTPEVPEGEEAGLPEGAVCNTGDREEISPGVFMACVNGQWQMPTEPAPPSGGGVPPGGVTPPGGVAPPSEWGEELPPGAVCREGETAPIEGGLSMKCVGGQWATPEPTGAGGVTPGEIPPEGMPPAEYVPPAAGVEVSPAEEGGYVAPETGDVMEMPGDVKEEIANEIQGVTIPEAEKWSEEGPVPGTVVPKPETGLPQIPVPLFGINISKMVGWTGRTIEFQEIIPGVRATPIPWVIPPVNEIPVIGPMISSTIDKIPLLPGFIIRGEDGKVENEGMRLPTVPRNLVGLPAIPVPEPLPKANFGYEEKPGEVTLPGEGEGGLGFRTPPWLLSGEEEAPEDSLGFRQRGYPLI